MPDRSGNIARLIPADVMAETWAAQRMLERTRGKAGPVIIIGIWALGCPDARHRSCS